MSQDINDLSGNALFELRVRQAILAAQHSVKQVGLLIIDFNDMANQLTAPGGFVLEFSEKMWMRLRGALRDSDTVVRMDGGRMAVLLPSVTGADDVVLVANKILSKFDKPLSVQDLKVRMPPRIGIALFPEHSTSANSLIARADLALTVAKRTKSRCVVYSQEHAKAPRNQLKMSELRQAIVADQLFLHYQPKINLKTGRVSGLEVLTRWQHPKLGVIAPDEFIPVAERTGLIIPLTLWVLQQGLLQNRSWNDMKIDVTIAVNLSMWNLDSQELPDQIQSMLQNIGVPPERLELEITESAIMGDPESAMRTLTRIRDLGVSFYIDDFGTGYSSLAYLKKLPVAGMKIDKSFVQTMDHDRDNAVIVRSIIDLAHNLGLKVVAEGVENDASRQMLAEFGCDEVQGYYYSRPIPADAITQFLIEPPVPIAQSSLLGDSISTAARHGSNGLNGKSAGANGNGRGEDKTDNEERGLLNAENAKGEEDSR
jgi:predicted signal transduction protein with EAL and GGDEF domain